ncbi:hypothetical protein HOV03_gp77 [Gordonia phage Asapag]|uniref:Uncharacterized protein n=1 Tax=Gordonia phage Asapag TaxID=2507862 RepID=A0A410TDV9_9CAUD|nr:hypothetical protein HOV03_gp77 [Gordonia phage Asapag]QAU07217.1 hypothetical protein SEA_ASAPAG_77 [Gordonia phage Asapag]
MSEHEWPKTTPTGQFYTAPTTYAELCSRHTDAAQAAVECWSPDECPPEPTWEMVGLAHREVERLRDVIQQADSILSLLHYRGIINSENNRRDVEAAMNRCRSALKELGGPHV